MLIMNKEIAVTDRQIVLSIIIVNYNVKEYILNCIQSIQDKIDANRCPYEVIVSDNGSVDGSVEAIRERFPWVKVIENNANLGFGKANNIGAKQAKGEVLFFLNPDTVINYGIEEMCDYILHHPQTGVLSPLVLDENSSINLAPFYSFDYNIFLLVLGLITLRPYTLLYSYRLHKNIKYKRIFNTNIITGCSMMMRKNVFIQIHCFDENLFMYSEEFDIEQKIRRHHYLIQLDTQASITHYGDTPIHFLKVNQQIAAHSQKVVLQTHFHYTWILRYILLMLNYCKYTLSLELKGILGFFVKKNKIGYLNFNRVKWNLLLIKAMYKELLARDKVV